MVKHRIYGDSGVAACTWKRLININSAFSTLFQGAVRYRPAGEGYQFPAGLSEKGLYRENPWGSRPAVPRLSGGEGAPGGLGIGYVRKVWFP